MVLGDVVCGAWGSWGHGQAGVRQGTCFVFSFLFLSLMKDMECDGNWIYWWFLLIGDVRQGSRVGV